MCLVFSRSLHNSTSFFIPNTCPQCLLSCLLFVLGSAGSAQILTDKFVVYTLKVFNTTTLPRLCQPFPYVTIAPQIVFGLHQNGPKWYWYFVFLSLAQLLRTFHIEIFEIIAHKHLQITTVSREGLAPIVKAYSRLIPVDGLVL